MRAGELDRRIVIETPTDTQDSAGGPTQTWATFATVWAKVIPLRGQEYFAANQNNTQVDSTFRIRWLSGVTATMRISYDGEYWDIQHIAEIGRQEGLDLLARVHQA